MGRRIYKYIKQPTTYDDKELEELYEELKQLGCGGILKDIIEVERQGIVRESVVSN